MPHYEGSHPRSLTPPHLLGPPLRLVMRSKMEQDTGLPKLGECAIKYTWRGWDSRHALHCPGLPAIYQKWPKARLEGWFDTIKSLVLRFSNFSFNDLNLEKQGCDCSSCLLSQRQACKQPNTQPQGSGYINCLQWHSEILCNHLSNLYKIFNDQYNLIKNANYKICRI